VNYERSLQRHQPIPLILIAHHRREFKRDHPPRIQGQILSGRRVASSPGYLLINGELPKPTDKNILTPREICFDGFQDSFIKLGRFEFRNAKAVSNGLDVMIFGDGYGRLFPWFMSHMSITSKVYSL
jgi:hypothetical protein